MNVTRMNIQGYRSLRDVELIWRPLTVLIGPNNAGKSNIIDAISFYTDMLFNPDVAINSRGGFQHLVFRGLHGVDQSITFGVEATLSIAEVAAHNRYNGAIQEPRIGELDIASFRLAHRMSLAPDPSNVLSGFVIEYEELSIQAETEEGAVHQIMNNGVLVHPELNVSLRDLLLWRPFQSSESIGLLRPLNEPMPQSIVDQLRLYSPVVEAFRQGISTTKIYLVEPLCGRAPGLPSVVGDVLANGQQLPTLVSYLQSRHPDAWANVLQWVRLVAPSIGEITVRSDHDRLLRLEFVDTGLSVPWTDKEVSDGTIRSLALFAALSDPRWRLQLFEEPENSLHPWAIRSFVDACREVTADPSGKQIMLTTHSPVLIDAVTPDEITVVWRKDGATSIKPLVELEPTAQEFWAEGHGKISELLASGLFIETVPLGS